MGTKRPTYFTGLNPFWVRRGLLRAYNFTHGGREIGGTMKPWALGTGASFAQGADGVGLSGGPFPNGGGQIPNNGLQNKISDQLTVIIDVDLIALATNGNDFIFGQVAPSGGSYNWGIYGGGADFWFAYVNNGGGGVAAGGTVGPFRPTRPYRIIVGMTYSALRSEIRLYADGKYQESATQTGNIATNDVAISSGWWNTGGASYILRSAIVANKCWTDAEMAVFGKNTWPAYRPARPPAQVTTAAPVTYSPPYSIFMYPVAP